MKRRLAVLLATMLALLAGGAKAQLRTQVTLPLEAEIRRDLAKAPCDNKERLGAVKSLFSQLGATDADVSVASFKHTENLVATVKGSGDGFIGVGAHYDKASHGCGAVDNWTGIVILAHLYRTIRVTAPSKTIIFVAFGKEEAGLVGSHAMVDAITKKDRESYCSMVNLDSFGFARPQVLENVSTPKLTAFVAEVARENQVPYASAKVDAGADSTSFRDKGIPAVTLHGLSNTGLSLIHTSKDQVDQISAESVHIGYRFALMLIARLDQCDCKAFR